MTEKIKVWKCEECKGGDGCLAVDLDLISSPDHCVNEFSTCNSHWKQTDEYEITKKMPDRSAPKVFIFDSIEEREAFLKSKVEPKTGPNCSICEWKEKFEKLESATKYLVAPILQCTAQGFKDAADCYNSAECQILFKPKS